MKIYLLEIGAYLEASSTTSRTIGAGAHTLTLAADTFGAPPGLALVGASLTADAGGGNTMTGTVTSYDPATRQLVLNVTSVAGAGTFASWTIGGAVTLRYASGVGYNHASAPGFYWPRPIAPFWLRRTAFAADRVGGAVQVGLGEAVLANADGRLDKLRHYGFGGRMATLLVGDSAAAYSTFTTELSAVIDQAVHDWAEGRPSQIILRLRDRLEDLRKPLQGTKYAGTNSGSPESGLEGKADTIKGKPKPVAVGTFFEAEGVPVNDSLRAYQWHDGALQSLTVKVAGKELTAGADYASQADFENVALAPASGQFRRYLALGMARIGDAPAGPVTADGSVGATAADRTVGQILKSLATRPNGIASGDVTGADVTALDAAQGAECGWHFLAETTILDAMNVIAPGAGAWFGFDRLNKLRMKQLAAPSGSPVVTFKRLAPGVPATSTTVDLLSVTRVANGERNFSVPVWRVVVHYKRCHTPQNSGFDTSISDARKAFLANEWRAAVAEESAVKTKHPNALELHVFTPLATEAAAAAEASRVLALWKVARDQLSLKVRWDAATAALVDLGAVAQLEIPRFDYDAGALVAVVDLERDAAKEIAVVGVWA